MTFRLDTGATAATQGLTLVIDSEEFVLKEADRINGGKTQWKWNNTTLSWTAGTDVAVSLVVTDAPATGQPTISGAAQVSKTLTAATDDIEDLDGLPTTPTFTYQWVRVDGFTDTDIPGATSETYTLTASDLGKQIKVTVSFTDSRGHAEGPLTSGAYPPNGTVVALPGPCPAVNDWCAANVLALDSNPMTGPQRGRRSVDNALAIDRQHLVRLTAEPFIGRLDVDWTDEKPPRRETLYITRGSPAGLGGAIKGASVASYRAPLGRLAEFAAGEDADINIAGQNRCVRIRERVRLRPAQTDGEWDGLDDRFEFTRWSAAIDSIRTFLIQLDEPEAQVDDVLGAILGQAARETQVREELRRHVVDRMALRDQPILDHYQGEVFRLPIDRRLVLLGPPGTGKTTTLIKRLAQKRSADALTDDEHDLLSRLGLSSSVSDPAGWAMFSPTELLKQYLRDAFNREGVPATDGNLTTWARQRLTLARGALRILRTPDSGRFRIDENATPLLDQSSPGITRLQQEFETFFNVSMFQQARDSLQHLRLHGGDAVNRILRTQLGRIESGQFTSPRDLTGILDQSGLQAELQRLQDENGDELKRMGNRLVRDHTDLMDEMV